MQCRALLWTLMIFLKIDFFDNLFVWSKFITIIFVIKICNKNLQNFLKIIKLCTQTTNVKHFFLWGESWSIFPFQILSSNPLGIYIVGWVRIITLNVNFIWYDIDILQWYHLISVLNVYRRRKKYFLFI